MHILYILLILLVFSRLFSEVMRRMHLPALLGEILAGVFIGVVVNQFSGTFPTLAHISTNEVFVGIADLGIFFLMLYAGLELNPKEFVKASKDSFWIALGGMLLPLLLGCGLGWYVLPDSEFKMAQTLFMGVALAITAVPVAIKVLMDLGKLKDRSGQIIVSAAVIDDILSLLLLAVLTGVIEKGGIPGAGELLLLMGNVFVFIVISFVVGVYILPLLGKFLLNRAVIEEFEFSMLLIVGLAFSVLAEFLGMHFLLGAFAAGLFFVRRKGSIPPKIYNDVQKKVKAITTGFLAPIFFASIGLHLDITAVAAVPGFVALVIIIAILSKVVGAGIPAMFVGLDRKEATVVGFAMNARGAVELIIADIALRAGIFDLPKGNEIIENMFSTIVVMAILTTIMTPIALKLILGKDASENGKK